MNYTDIRPSNRQLAWQKLEFYGFVHYGINTYTDREWGDGSEDPSLFNPSNLDCDSWVRTMKEAGMKGAIITAKHHDGFCLWPSKYTEHSVKNSPYKNGEGDVVKEFSNACSKYGLKFGFYLSPWDMHEGTYGQGKAYDDYFVAQLEELLTNYGEVFEVWFDGANGEGPNGKVQVYDWDRYYRVIRHHQPNAVIAISGPDVRWVGNEAGKSRKNEWSVVPKSLQDNQKIAEDSQQVDDGKFIHKFNAEDEDLGSRELLDSYKGELVWYPAEVDTSIRPGWFYHEDQDDSVRTVDELWEIYLDSVGNNCTLLLNIPPNKEGVFSEEDTASLKGLGARIKRLYSNNVIEEATLETREDLLIYTFDKAVETNVIGIGEDISLSQRIEEVRIRGYLQDELIFETIEEAVGYRKLVEVGACKLDRLEVECVKYRAKPIVNYVLVSKV